MGRLLPWLLVLAALAILAIVRQQAPRPRSDRTYRPRANPWGRAGAPTPEWSDAAPRGGTATVDRAELDGLRDAYSSAALDPQRPLFRCCTCQAYYHRASLDALNAHNHGGCALCGGSEMRAVRVL